MINGTPEASIYNRLTSIQGKYIPFNLGLLILDTPIVLPGLVKTSHALLLSFAGHKLGFADFGKVEDVKAQVSKGLRAIHRLGICHGDPRMANFLINDKGEVRIIDFDCAQVEPEG